MPDTPTVETHPELLMGPNPFIEILPPFLDSREMHQLLGRKPLEGKPWRELAPARREPLLHFATDHFVSTSPVLLIAVSIQTLIRSSMALRNPLNKLEQRRTNRIGVAEDKIEIKSVPHLNASGGIIQGVTGMGKTSTTQRVLSIVAPQQVVDYGPSASCGWQRLRQVVWLHVDYPSNGTRGALLKRILSALDAAVGSSYHDNNLRVENIDSLLTTVVKLLSLHRVALLIIDEKQERNFQNSPWAIEFTLFYLSLMNLGISTLLIGNPLAFEHIYSFAQVIRRFSGGGIHKLIPAGSLDELWWKRSFVPNARDFCLVDSVAIDPKVRSEFEFKHTAGVPALLQMLNVESQRFALRRSTGNTAELTMADMFAALKSPAFSDISEMARQIHSMTPFEREMIDIPSKPMNSSGDGAQLSLIPDKITSDGLIQIARKFKATQASALGKFVAKIKSISNLTPEEIKELGISAELLKEAEKIESEIKNITPKNKLKK